MFDYRKITGTRKLRMAVLSLLSWVPDKLMLKIQYYLQTGKKLHLNPPVTFNEKIQAYKLFYHNPEMRQCVDKVEVKKYVKGKGYNDKLVPLLGVFDNLEEIDFDTLPGKFVVKTSDGGGSNEVYICKNKNEETIKEIKQKIKQWLKAPRSKKHVGREWAYENNFPRRILIEELLEDPAGGEDIDDFKFFCYQGKYKILEWHKDRNTSHRAAHYDENLKYLPEFYTYKIMHEDNPLPENIKEMVKMAEKLAEDFPFVRVDLYNVGGKIYFGEMTFYPASGYFIYRPENINKWMGDFLEYPFKTRE